MTSGVLVLDKPEGPTSHDMVQLARRALRTRQIGHTGTLDPMATGVLVLCVGQATRLARFLSASRKVYEARVRCGWETDTLDRTGTPLGPQRTPEVDPLEVQRALDALTGRQLQQPPSYSAKRIGGIRAHRLARAGQPAELRPVEVEFEKFQDVEVLGAEIRLQVFCSAGTYIRSLARDLGRTLGTGAHLQQLRRTQSGEFGIDQAQDTARLQHARRQEALSSVIPLRELELGMPAVEVRPEFVTPLTHGNPLKDGSWNGPGPAVGSDCRILGPQGDLLAVTVAESVDGGLRLQPRVVLISPRQGVR